MLAILAATALGTYLGNHIEFRFHPEETFFFFCSAPALPTDIRWFWASLFFVCASAVAAGKGARRLVETVALPWLVLAGLHLPSLPTLVSPATQKGEIAQPIKRQAA